MHYVFSLRLMITIDFSFKFVSDMAAFGLAIGGLCFLSNIVLAQGMSKVSTLLMHLPWPWGKHGVLGFPLHLGLRFVKIFCTLELPLLWPCDLQLCVWISSTIYFCLGWQQWVLLFWLPFVLWAVKSSSFCAAFLAFMAYMLLQLCLYSWLGAQSLYSET